MTIHAIIRGTFAELQQTSNNTFRVHDPHGRPIQKEESFLSLDRNGREINQFISPAAPSGRDTVEYAFDNDFFTLAQVELPRGERCSGQTNGRPVLLCIIEGSGSVAGIDEPLGVGERKKFVLVPGAAETYEIEAAERVKVLVCSEPVPQ